MCSITVTSSRYRIVVRGRLSERFAGAFDGMAMEPRPGETAFEGEIVDQARLHGVIERIRDLGLELISVEEVRP